MLPRPNYQPHYRETGPGNQLHWTTKTTFFEISYTDKICTFSQFLYSSELGPLPIGLGQHVAINSPTAHHCQVTSANSQQASHYRTNLPWGQFVMGGGAGQASGWAECLEPNAAVSALGVKMGSPVPPSPMLPPAPTRSALCPPARSLAQLSLQPTAASCPHSELVVWSCPVATWW